MPLVKADFFVLTFDPARTILEMDCEGGAGVLPSPSERKVRKKCVILRHDRNLFVNLYCYEIKKFTCSISGVLVDGNILSRLLFFYEYSEAT